jgi:hypothetical protein
MGDRVAFTQGFKQQVVGVICGFVYREDPSGVVAVVRVRNNYLDMPIRYLTFLPDETSSGAKYGEVGGGAGPPISREEIAERQHEFNESIRNSPIKYPTSET